MKYLILPQCPVNKSCLEVDGKDHHYLTHVLRLKEGTELRLSDGNGHVTSGKVLSCGRRSLQLDLQLPWEKVKLPEPKLVLFYGLAKDSKTDLAFQKATEMGVSRIIPVQCEYSPVSHKTEEKRLQRWGEIVLNAGRQSEAAILPRLDSPKRFSDALTDILELDQSVSRWVAHPSAKADAITENSFKGHSTIVVAIGPEGGFSENEIGTLQDANFRPFTLGSQILRTETAVVAGLTLFNFLSGKMAYSSSIMERH